VLNQKGGVLKTTAAVNIAERLARRDLRVLVIDMDKQGAATSTLRAEELSLDDRTIADVLRAPDKARDFLLEAAILPADAQWGGVEVVPASLDLEDVWTSSRPALVFRLRSAIDQAELATRYDWVLLDGPPDLGPGTVSAVIAADNVVVPFRPERMSMDGVARTVETVEVVRRDMRSDVRLAAVIPVAVDKGVGEHVVRVDEARRRYGDLVTETVIPHRLKSDEASGSGHPASSLEAPAGPALAAAYDALTDELIKRTEGVEW
jgi:chromosome partitioning protein